MNTYRYSIIPAAAILDPALKPRDLKILALLGRHTNRNGWCRRSQTTLAEEAGCVRSTIQASLDRLTKAGYVEVRLEGIKGRAAPAPGSQPYRSHSYRVLLDLDDQQIQRATGEGARKIGHPQNRHGVPTDEQNSARKADGIRSAPGAEVFPKADVVDLFEDLESEQQAETVENGTSSAPVYELSPSELSPPNSPKRESEQEKLTTANLAEFQAAWGTSAVDNVGRTMRAWGALTVEQREAAIAGIKAFKAELERSKRTHVIASWRYLEERRWELLAIDKGDWVDVKPLSRDWWALLFHKIDQREKMGAFVQHSLSTTVPVPCRREAMPSLDLIARLEAYPENGEAMKAWRPWFEARGIRIPVRDALWVFLPSSEPPESGASVWKGKHHAPA